MFLVFLTITILPEVRCYLIVFFICISLMINGVELSRPIHQFRAIVHFSIGFFFFAELLIPYVLLLSTSSQKNNLQIFSRLCRLFLHSVDYVKLIFITNERLGSCQPAGRHPISRYHWLECLYFLQCVCLEHVCWKSADMSVGLILGSLLYSTGLCVYIYVNTMLICACVFVWSYQLNLRPCIYERSHVSPSCTPICY